MAAVRDAQKQKVYDAEKDVRDLLAQASSGHRRFELHGSVYTIDTDIKFGALEHVQRYVDVLLAKPWVQARWPQRSSRPIKVRHRKGNKFAHYEHPGVIALHEAPTGKSWSMRELVVLHEVAHHMEFGEPHGPAFVAAFCELVTNEISPEVGHYLKVRMLECGAKINI